MSSREAPAVRPASREIARAAVQAELSLAAYDLVVEKGYDNVTLDDMAAAGGVSRSTFLRYFRTKDQAILVALKAYVERMADALRARPGEEGDWAALRSAIESFVVPIYTRNPAGAQAISRLAMFTRTLSGTHLERAVFCPGCQCRRFRGEYWGRPAFGRRCCGSTRCQFPRRLRANHQPTSLDQGGRCNLARCAARRG